MQISLVAVMSMDGLITRGDNPDVTAWSSPEDGQHFRTLVAQHDAVVIGATTYQTVQPRPEPARLRLVMTHAPGAYQHDAQAGMLEFVDASPSEIVSRLRHAGRRRLLVAGGSQVYAAFLEARLVDDIYLTVEPLMFGTGTPLLSERKVFSECRLVSSEVLNDRGTLLLHYRVR